MDATGDGLVATMDQTAPLSPPSPGNVKETTETSVPKPANALTPPTSEEMNHEVRQEQEDSELSDLDLDSDDEEIEPDHYWDGGKIPVFKPTVDQFRSFKKYVSKIDKYGMKSGIVKVIPPKEWRDSLPALDEYIKRIKIKNPITQEFNGTFGTYTQQNVEKQRSYNLPEWKALTEETHHQPPAKRGERRRNQEKVVRGGVQPRTRVATDIAAGPQDGSDTSKSKRKPGRPKRSAPTTEDADSDGESKVSKAVPKEKAEKTFKANKRKGRPSGAGGNGQSKSVTSRRLNNTAEAADHVDEAAFRDFNYRMEGLDEFTPERCAELETNYWKSLAFNQPMYAADMPGSLFDDTTTSWNVAKLENLLDVLGTKVPGVNTAYLYLGMWKATFAWHLEDVDLYSINYIHFGAPKQWYSISQEDARRFEAAMKNIWPQDAKNCDQFLRHKTYLISPDVLQKQYNVKVNKLVHYEGEFVITYPYGYHSGYNIGYNCAESVNFATEEWLEYGRIARKCNCEADNVWVDVAEIERKLRGEPTPEFYEETDDDDSDLGDDEDGKLPTPPASIKGQKSQSRKRKRETKQEVPKKKKKIRIRIKAPTREPCVMCPNDSPWEPLLPTDNGKKAHRSCALFTPETWIHVEGDKEIVCGVTTIDKARMDLKCNFCRSKRGACFQCSAKKCTRAFHATCALAAGVQVDAGPVPTFGEDGTEYFETGYDFRCKFHRPKVPKNLTVEMLENSKRVSNFAKDLQAGDVVQAQLIGGEVFAGLVIENRPSELSVLVDVIPDFIRVEVDWKWLCVLDPKDSTRPKPSPNAIPMPEGMNKQSVSIDNRQDGVPKQDEPFTDNSSLKWADFTNVDMPPQGYSHSKFESQKVKVDMDAQDQLYYYLPASSTEAKCFFTDSVGGTEHAPKSNFLDRVKGKATHSYQAQRQSLAATYPAPPPGANRHALAAVGQSAKAQRKPYTYKPRDLAHSQMYAIDQQALANQRNFTAQVGHHPGNAPPHHPQDSRRSSEDSRDGTPLRAFPLEQYYSTNTLPAAFPGKYSGFTREVRRQSQGAQTLPQPNPQLFNYTPNYSSVSQQMAQLRQVPQSAQPPYQHIAPSMAFSQSGGHQPPPYSYSQYAPSGPPAISQTQRGDLPTSTPLPSILVDSGVDRQSMHTPTASIGSVNAENRKLSGEWTPPSQRPGVPTYRTPPPISGGLQSDAQQNQPSISDFQQQHQPHPSIASREGAHLRAMREKGYVQPAYPPYQRNSFGHAIDAAHHVWQSPAAPTASPLSGPNTPSMDLGGQATSSSDRQIWGALSRAGQQQGMLPTWKASDNEYGPMLPQMEPSNGNETWRYG